MRTLPFTKMVGAGNDFVVLDTIRQRRAGLERQWPAVSRHLCDRRTGIGADGVLLLEPSRRADARMRVFNPDGSEAEMCGNGARCVAWYLKNGARRRAVTIETRAGVLSAQVNGPRVAMRMTDPTEIRVGERLRVATSRHTYSRANTGVPHAVLYVPSVDRVDVNRLGRLIRLHRRFAPHGTNVNFIQVGRRRPTALRIRTYERGVEGETLACGTGVTAAAVVHAIRLAQSTRPKRSGSARRYQLEVTTQGGDLLKVSLRVTPAEGGCRVSEVVLEGPARWVFEGSVLWPPERHS